MSILDCETYDSALESFAELHDMPRGDVLSFIEGQRPEELEEACRLSDERWDDILYGRWLEHASQPDGWEETCWFHATRLFDDHTIWHDGLLPLSGMEDELWTKLREISKGEIDEESWSNFVGEVKTNYRYGTKQNDVSEGPFAFLVFEPLMHYSSPEAASRDYFQGSELVEDICFGIDRNVGEILWERYQDETTPCAVKFTTPRQNYEMEVVLHYLWVKEWEPDEMVSSLYANTCYSGKGTPIYPGDILNIIEIDI